MKVVETPKHKKDWARKYLLLNEKCPEGYLEPPDGMMVLIERRLNARETMHSSQDVSRWGAIRALLCSWRCNACGAWHRGYMPESWIEDGKAYFVEQ